MSEISPTSISELHPRMEPDNYWVSAGVTWIYQHPEAFLKMLSEAKVSIASFIQPYLKNRCIKTLLSCESLLLGIEDNQRLPFIRKVFLTKGSCYEAWLTTALKAGVSRDDLAELVLTKLREEVVDRRFYWSTFLLDSFFANSEASNQDIYLEVPNNPETYWTILADEQLHEALTIVVEKLPEAILKEWGGEWVEKVAARLGSDVAQHLLAKAADEILSLEQVDPRTMSLLPLDVQLRTVRHFVAVGEFAPIPIVASMALTGGLDVFEEFKPVLSDTFYHFDYEEWWKQVDTIGNPDKSLVEAIDASLRDILTHNGYAVGVVTTKKEDGKPRLGLEDDGLFYPISKYSTTSDIVPEEGDIVVFDKRHYQKEVSTELFWFIRRPR